MTCARALEQMLAADPDELAGQVNSAMATHLRSCSRCGAVAARLSVETGVLASAVALHRSRTPVPVKWSAAWYHPGALVAVTAGVIAAVLLRTSGERLPSAAPTPVAAVVVAAPSAQPRDRAPAPSAARPVRAREVLRSYPRATALTARPLRPVAFQPGEVSAVLSPAVVVTPPAGQRAVVLRSTQSGITVVWLY